MAGMAWTCTDTYETYETSGVYSASRGAEMILQTAALFPLAPASAPWLQYWTSWGLRLSLLSLDYPSTNASLSLKRLMA
jgi:hypothetical protein